MDRAEKLQKIQQIIDGVRLRIDQGDAVSDEEIEILVAQNPILASELGEGLKKLTANCQTAQHRESEPVSPPHEVIPDSDVQKLRDRSWPELISSDIGQFKMIEELSRGGQGIVFKFRQEHPVRREAALKLLLEVEDPNVARFQIESGALARMDHPNVAKVIQAGTTKNKQPYFLMEYVPGIKITKYCDENRLTIEERLLVFIDVCKGIQHAHQKGIIHRDIKPSNVLVMDQISGDVTNPHQKKGRIPKVIDFGLAKPTDLRLSEKTVDTQFG